MHLLGPTDRHQTEITTPSSVKTRAARALGVAGAVLAAVAVWTVADPVLGIELLVEMDTEPQPIGVQAVVASSLVSGLAGWGLVALLERVTARARRVWTGTALVVLMLSLLGPPAAVTTAATVALAAMHLAVAVVLIPALTTVAPPGHIAAR